MSEQARSRIEAILGNMLGGDYTVLPPFSRNEVLLLALSDQWATIQEALTDAPTTPITNAQIDAVIAAL